MESTRNGQTWLQRVLFLLLCGCSVMFPLLEASAQRSPQATSGPATRSGGENPSPNTPAPVYDQLLPNELEQLASTAVPQQPEGTFGKGLFGYPAFSPDGQWLAVPTPRRIELYATRDWQQVAFLETAGPGTSTRFSPDSRRLVCRLRDNGEIEVWDVPTRTRLTTLKGGRGEVWAGPYFSRDGRYLLDDSFGTICRWDMETFQSLEPIQTARMWGEYYSFEPNQDIVAMINMNRRVAEIWDVRTGELRICLPVDRGNITRLEFSPDGKKLAVLRVFRAAYRCEFGEKQEGSLINLWDTTTWRKLKTLRGDYDTFAGNIAFGSDSRTLAVAGWDGTLSLWDVRQGERVRVLQERSKGWSGGWTVFQPDGDRLLSVLILTEAGPALRIWDARRGRLLHELRGYNIGLETVRLSPDGNLLVTAGWRRSQLWDVRKGVPLSFPAAVGRPYEFSPDGTQLVCQDGKYVRLVRVPSGEVVWQFQPPRTAWVPHFRFTPDGKLLGWLAERSPEDNLWNVSIWNLSDRSPVLPLGQFRSGTAGMDFSHDGRFVAHADKEDGSVSVWWIPEGGDPICLPPLRESNRRSSMRLAFSLVTSHLAVWRGGIGVEVYDLEAADPTFPIYALELPTWAGHWLAFSPDGKVLSLPLSRYHGLLLWEMAEHRAAFLAIPRAYDLADVSFDRDGQLLALGGDSGVAALWKDPIRVLREGGQSLKRASRLMATPEYLHHRLFSGQDVEVDTGPGPTRRSLLQYKPDLRTVTPNVSRKAQPIPSPFGPPTTPPGITPAYSPFGPEASWSYTVHQQSTVTMKLYGWDGKLVQVIPLGEKRPGDYRFDWPARTRDGERLPSGVYFWEVEEDGQVTGRGHVVVK